MKYILNSYEPTSIFHYFEDISRIPRGSGNEAEIAEYLCDFARANGLEYKKDERNNVLILKEGTGELKDHPPVMLQGHTDMVCEKNSDVTHDFTKDPLKLKVENDWLYAEGTTLGGDDGAAVVIMMGILADKSLTHPPLECLFTVEEETGLGGAECFDYSCIRSKRIINLDSELEGEAVASCAGSMNLKFTLDGEYIPFANKTMKIKISGLAGGHSGTDIDSGRANANLLMGRILAKLYDRMEFNLISIQGGNKRNAIPRECEAMIAVLDREEALKIILEAEAEIDKELCDADKGFKVRVSNIGKREKMLTFKDTSKILSLLTLVPNGVISMSQSKKGLVESSSNLGVIETLDDGKICFYAYSRSSVEPMADHIFIKMKRLSKLLGIETELLDRYPGWAFNKDSELQGLYIDTYKELYGETEEFPRIAAIHAGLECGIILEKLGGGDAISIGPNMKDIHTPTEMLDLRSMERIWKLVVSMLGKM